jgi:hypothetical protein
MLLPWPVASVGAKEWKMEEGKEHGRGAHLEDHDGEDHEKVGKHDGKHISIDLLRRRDKQTYAPQWKESGNCR